MLQIDHIYKFFFNELFTEFEVWFFQNGFPNFEDVSGSTNIFSKHISESEKMILFYDQEPVFSDVTNSVLQRAKKGGHQIQIISTSEKNYKHDLFPHLYYFYHGFTSLDWFRGFYILNYNKKIIKDYMYDYQSFNRIITGARRYRKVFVDRLRINDLLKYGAVSYGVTDDSVTEERLVVDHVQLPGSASADIPDINAFWNIVTETVFYYDKLHLTEKIFKPIVSKQPFMLLAAPGNLEYLRSYGFKTFDTVIDESYDNIQNNDDRIDAVVKQLVWYCALSDSQKIEVMKELEPIIEYNFHWFYNDFKHVITSELLENTKNIFKQINEDDSHINYQQIYELLTK